MKNKKIKDNILDSLLSRQDYLVVQANDLARAFGNLNAFEHKLLDYCFSYVTSEHNVTDIFKATSKEIIRHFGLTHSGRTYGQIARGFKTLNENTALYIPIVRDGVRGILMTQLFRKIEFLANGEVSFRFSEEAAPYVFALRSQYYSFKLAELSQIKSKYTLILLKLWEAKRINKQVSTIIEGNIEEWKTWFLGENKKMDTGIFKRNVIVKSCEDLERKMNVEIFLTTIKNGRVVTGYEMRIVDTRVRR